MSFSSCAWPRWPLLPSSLHLVSPRFWQMFPSIVSSLREPAKGHTHCFISKYPYGSDHSANKNSAACAVFKPRKFQNNLIRGITWATVKEVVMPIRSFFLFKAKIYLASATWGLFSFCSCIGKTHAPILCKHGRFQMLPMLTSYGCILLIQNSKAPFTYVFTFCKHPLLYPGTEPDLTEDSPGRVSTRLSWHCLPRAS